MIWNTIIKISPIYQAGTVAQPSLNATLRISSGRELGAPVTVCVSRITSPGKALNTMTPDRHAAVRELAYTDAEHTDDPAALLEALAAAEARIAELEADLDRTHHAGAADRAARSEAPLASDTHSVVKQLNILNRIIALANSTLDSGTVLHYTCRELTNVLGLPCARAYLLENGGSVARLMATYDRAGCLQSAPEKLWLKSDPVIDYLQRYKIPLLVDTQTETGIPRFDNLTEDAQLVAPLVIDGTLVGLIYLEAAGARGISNADLGMAASVTHAASQALDKSLLYQRVQQHSADLERMVAQRTAQLSNLNDRMAVILANTSDTIILTRPGGEINITNPAFDELFGYSRDELFGQPVRDLLESQFRKRLDAAIALVIENGGRQRLEVVARRKDGATFDADIALTRVTNDDSPHALFSLRDITHLKEVERMKDRFISTVSHELRTPITNVMLSSGTLNQFYDRLPEERRLKSIAQIYQQAQLLAELVESILDLSRVESRRGRASHDPVNFGQVVDGVVTELNLSAVAKQIDVAAHVAAEPMIVCGESVDIARLWRNLVSNAIKYTPNEGRIDVRAGRIQVEADGTATVLDADIDTAQDCRSAELAPGVYIVGQVTDTGHGMDEDDLEKLFTRFHRGWANTSNIPGTGLGLALVRELLDQYGGDIHVKSQLDQGSTFTFWLPAAPIEQEGDE
jgi:PAS domain S-box-containing protein